MPRAPRGLLPEGRVYHFWFRLVDGRFLIDDEAREEYLRRLDRALRKSCGWTLIAYAVMSTHVHLLFIVGRAPLGTWIQGAHVGFAQWINARRRCAHPKTLGHVIAERPHHKPVPIENTGITIAYLHNNPRDAGVVDCPSQSTWTSHRDYLGLRTSIAALNVFKGLELAGFEDDPAAFHEFVLRRRELTSWEADDEAPLLVVRAAQLSGAPIDDVRNGAKTRVAVRARRLALEAWAQLGRPASSMAPHLGISGSAAARLRKSVSGDLQADVLRVLQDVFRAA